MNKTITATLTIEDNTISVAELTDLFAGASAKIKGLSVLLNQQSREANSLCKYLLTAIKDDKSAAIMVDQIDLPQSLSALVKLAAEVGNRLDPVAYSEAYEIFCKEVVNGDSVYVDTRFLGMKLFVTRMEDTGTEQKERFNQKWLENFLDINFKTTDTSLTLDVSAVFFGQPD